MADKKQSKDKATSEKKAAKPAQAAPAKKETKETKSTVNEGDTIKIDYKGTLEDGTVFDSSERLGEPLEFTVGARQVIKGFDAAVRGMKRGEEKEIKLQPHEAYGDPNPELVKQVPRAQLPPQPDPTVGMMLMITLPNGVQLPAKITKVENGNVTIDLNHPLSGKVLNFWFKIIDIS